MFQNLNGKNTYSGAAWSRSLALLLAIAIHAAVVAAAIGFAPKTQAVKPDPDDHIRIRLPGPIPASKGHAPQSKPAKRLVRPRAMPAKPLAPVPEPLKNTEAIEESPVAPITSQASTGSGAPGDGQEGTGGEGGSGGPGTDTEVNGPHIVEESGPQWAGDGYSRPRTERADCLASAIHIPPELQRFVSRLLVRFAVEADGTVSHFSFPTRMPDPRIEEAVIAGVRSCTWVAGTDPRGQPTSLWVVQPIRLQ
jgi:hypothetical protein